MVENKIIMLPLFKPHSAERRHRCLQREEIYHRQAHHHLQRQAIVKTQQQAQGQEAS